MDQLRDTRAKETARRDTGLGASQTAEVAYLEKEGIPLRSMTLRLSQSWLPQTCLPEVAIAKKQLKKVKTIGDLRDSNS